MNRVNFASSASAETSASKPMTIGQLARQTGVSIKTLREYEHLGLIYTLGRGENNYRLFNDEALWCVQVIGILRSLGLTLKEIQEISAFYCQRSGELAGPRLAENWIRRYAALRRACLTWNQFGSASWTSKGLTL